MKKKRKILLAIALVILIGFGAVCMVLLPSADRTVRGLHIGSVDIGNMTQEEVKNCLTEVAMSVRTNGTVLELIETEETIWRVRSDEIDFVIDIDQTTDNAFKIGREGDLWKRLTDCYAARTRTDMVGYAVRYDEGKFKTIIDRIRDRIEVKPIEAHAEVVDGKVVIHPNQTGYLVDTEAVLVDIREFGAVLPRRALLHTKTIYAKVTTDALHDIKDVLGIYTTYFSTAATGRTHNIHLSAGAINGLLMKPNEVFSFNEVVGLRSAERGYQEAPVIVNGKMEPGLGGGICQVSTTLYNAVLLSDLSVIERECHFFPASYVPIGLDATVDYGNIDLVFRNCRQSDIYLWTKVDGGMITIAVLGNAQKEPVPNIAYYSEIEKVIPIETVRKDDPNLPIGEEKILEKGNQGYLSATYRGENGVYRLAYRDSYPATKRVIAVGTKKEEQTVKKTDAALPKVQQ